MKIIGLIIALIPIYLFSSCARSFTERMNQIGGSQSAIQNAIIDFSNTSSLYKKDSVFHLSVYSTFTKVNLKENKNGTYELVPGKVIDNIMAISIIANYNKFVEIYSNYKDQGASKIPTQYTEVDGKLFYWWDPSVPLTTETVNTFRSFDLLLPNDLDGVIEAAEFGEPVSSKAVHYFFCKNDLKTYKKVTSKVAIGYYDLPKGINCY